MSQRMECPLNEMEARRGGIVALTGHEDSIKETAHLTEEQIDLDESQKDEIGRLLS